MYKMIKRSKKSLYSGKEKFKHIKVVKAVRQIGTGSNHYLMRKDLMEKEQKTRYKTKI